MRAYLERLATGALVQATAQQVVFRAVERRRGGVDLWGQERGDAYSVGAWSLDDRKQCLLGVRRDLSVSHVRKIGGLLHTIRCMAINVIRRALRV